MGNNLCNEEGKKSVRLNSKDVERAENLGLADTSASTVFSELLERAEVLEKIRRRKKKQHREKRRELQDEAEFYGID